MTGAMYAAISGLKSHMSALNVIGNNISNVSTTAYKATRYTFNEALYTTSRSGSDGTEQQGGRNPAQIGYGANIGTIDIDMSTKNYTPTGYAMDCMIDGDGFFIVGDNKQNTGITSQEQLQAMSLSRLGNFNFDSNGYLVDGNGSLVYGFLKVSNPKESETPPIMNTADPNYEEAVSSILTPIRLPMCTVTTNETTGGAQTNVYRPTVEQDTTDKSKYYVQDASITTGEGANKEETLSRLQATSISIDATGAITAMTKDEQLIVVGYVAIAQVDNPNGVTHVDGRYYQALGGAGSVHLTTVGESVSYIPDAATAATGNNNNNAGTTTSKNAEWKNGNVTGGIVVEGAGDTKLITGGLESSGTDLATEITNMITVQRGYQANTRIVTVTDSMLEELVNMKR